MAAIAIPQKPERFFATPEEYLHYEALSSFKCEYYKGEVIAMAGGSIPHNTIVLQLLVALSIRLKGKSCKPYNNDNKVYIPQRKSYFYPDGMMACGEIVTDEKNGIVFNPKIVIEVLSPSTASFDRGEKFEAYRTLESLETYVLVSSTQVFVEVYTKKADDHWDLHLLRNIDALLSFSVIDTVIPLAEIYENVSWESEE